MHDRSRLPRSDPRPRDSTRGGEPEDLKAILSRWLARHGSGEKEGVERAAEAWREVAGQEVACQTRIARRSGGTLIIQVASPALLLELSAYRRPALLAALQAMPGLGGIRELRFQAGACGSGP